MAALLEVVEDAEDPAVVVDSADEAVVVVVASRVVADEEDSPVVVVAAAASPVEDAVVAVVVVDVVDTNCSPVGSVGCRSYVYYTRQLTSDLRGVTEWLPALNWSRVLQILMKMECAVCCVHDRLYRLGDLGTWRRREVYGQYESERV